MYSLPFVLILMAAVCNAVTIEDYCEVDAETTPCKTGCKCAEKYGNNCHTWQPLTPYQRQEVLDTHNKYREGVARGDYSAHQLPACEGGIKVMSYSKELEFLAGCWITQFIFGHDKMRRDLSNTCVGQNAHQIYSSANLCFPVNFISSGIGRWFDEYKKFTPAHSNLVKNFQPNKGTGHCTAMIWGNTNLVGCAIIHSRQPRRGKPEILDHACNLFCNYSKCGNFINAPIYKNETCERYSKQWPNLCGEIQPIKHFDAPEVGGASNGAPKPAANHGHKNKGLAHSFIQAVKKEIIALI